MISTSLKICIFLLSFIVLPQHLFSQSLVINEFLASNDSLNIDDDGEFPDWIELFNAGDSTIDLTGFSITDDLADPAKWLFPPMRLLAGEFLIVWASDKDKSDGELHSNFKITTDGEFLGIYNREGLVIDSLTFPRQHTNTSYGRLPDGSATWDFLPTPSPGMKNQDNGEFDTFKIEFSMESGVYDHSIDVALSTIPPGGDIRYTTNGDEPKANSSKYTTALNLNRITVVRAQVFRDGKSVSSLRTRAYIVNDRPQIPVVSVITAPKNLWDEHTGIYTNSDRSGDAWERPARMILIENNEVKFSAPAGLRIHGNSSRGNDKKNFRVYFRNEYGEADLDYKLFPQQPTDEFKRLILYAPSGDQPTGSEHWNMLHDHLSHAVLREVGGLFSGWKPVALYLNNEYWGIYWIRERTDHHFVETYLGFEDMDLHRSNWSSTPDVKEGDTKFWDETFAFFRNNDLRYTENFEKAKNVYLDLPNYTDYHIVNIFSANWDWPQNNLDRVSDRVGPDRRWRHIMWDTGAAWRFDAEHPTLVWATRDEVRTDIKYNDAEHVLWSTLILRKLLENHDYRHHFINRFADLLNTTFRSGHVNALKDSLARLIDPEVQRESDRWGGEGKWRWEHNVDIITRFVNRRPNVQRDQIREKFDISHTIDVTLEPAEGEGTVVLNTISPEDLPWDGVYFANIPVTLKARPAPGFQFSHWQGASSETDTVISIRSHSDFQIKAVFTQEPQEILQVKVDSITVSAAKITWQTAQPSETQIEYGIESVNIFSIADSTQNQEHAVWLTGLADSTIYQFQITATLGNDAVHHENTFTTLMDHTPPGLLSFRLDSLSHNFAAFKWLTTEEAQVSLHLFSDSLLIREHISAPDSALSGIAVLDSLHENTNYQVKAVFGDHRGNKTESRLIAFKTLVDKRAPKLLSVSIDSIKADSALVNWETDIASIGWLAFGRDSSAFVIISDSVNSMHHNLWLAGLAPKTQYFFQIFAQKISEGDTAASPIESFFTLLPSGIAADENWNGPPEQFFVSQNFPNPFRHITKINIAVPQKGWVNAVLYDIQGRLVKTFLNHEIEAGIANISWDGRDPFSQRVANGIYFLRVHFRAVKGKDQQMTRRLLLLR